MGSCRHGSVRAESRGPAVSSLGAACWPRDSQRRGAPSGFGEELEREDRRRSTRERGARPQYATPTLAPWLPGPTLQAGKGMSSLFPFPGWDAQPIQQRPEGQVRGCL